MTIVLIALKNKNMMSKLQKKCKSHIIYYNNNAFIKVPNTKPLIPCISLPKYKFYMIQNLCSICYLRHHSEVMFKTSSDKFPRIYHTLIPNKDF